MPSSAGSRVGARSTPVIVLTFVAALVAGCGLLGTRGEGPVVAESRQVAAFTRIEAGNGIGLTVTIGPAQSVTVSAQQNVMSVIASDVEAGTLKVRSKSSYSTDAGVTVAVVTSALDGVTLSGGSQARVDGLTAGTFEVQLTGGAVLTASGSATALTVAASGGSRASLEAIAAKTATVDASGGSTLNIQASESVKGSASGGSHVTVTGGAKIDVASSGGSSVTP